MKLSARVFFATYGCAVLLTAGAQAASSAGFSTVNSQEQAFQSEPDYQNAITIMPELDAALNTREKAFVVNEESTRTVFNGDGLFVYGEGAPGDAIGRTDLVKVLDIGLISKEDERRASDLNEKKSVQAQEYGSTSEIPHTTSRVDMYGAVASDKSPFRAVGKLFFNTGNQTASCTASLIRPGIIVTAAHCVAEYGSSRFYTDFRFIPAYANGEAPYGIWRYSDAFVSATFYDGTAK